LILIFKKSYRINGLFIDQFISLACADDFAHLTPLLSEPLLSQNGIFPALRDRSARRCQQHCRRTDKAAHRRRHSFGVATHMIPDVIGL
jgi:hypothetical protein